ncbi:MCE family protein [Nocardia puris]|uniref:MlaD family protein n=1 Tax=Nocardia puris TaxID=208602 RepID=UPI0018958CA8|nr:MlaD family protein [Nocardia puris]MBF6210175.1 MCE family protein [Nocardia puris]MBF6367252.1 MCE family protein [Nocardia puris]MBF6457436.1 MCE family protein [Nocardia puris]
MKLSSALSFSAIGLITVLGIAYLTFGVVRVDPLREDVHATLVLPNSSGLETGSPILYRGVEVGEVTGVRRGAGEVRVEFRVGRDSDLPVDSDITIEALSALGEPYIEFRPTSGGGPVVSDGQVLQGLRIQAPISTPEVARLVTQAMNQLDPEAIGEFIQTFGLALEGTESITPGLARSTDLLAAVIMSRSPAIGTMLTDLQSIATDMSWADPAFRAATPDFIEFGRRVDEIAEAVGRLARTGESPEMYLEGNGLVPFLQRLKAWIDVVGPDLAPLAPMLQPLADAAVYSIPQVDISALISQALQATEPEGAVHIRVNVK